MPMSKRKNHAAVFIFKGERVDLDSSFDAGKGSDNVFTGRTFFMEGNRGMGN